MRIEITCPNCHHCFNPNEAIDQSMRKAQVRGEGLVMLECSACFSDIAWRPNASPPETPFRCPVSHCSGWVSKLLSDEMDRSVLACGECGSEWRDPINFFIEITEIQAQYAYRTSCYRRGSSIEWSPAPFDLEVADYEQKVRDEPLDQKTTFVRG